MNQKSNLQQHHTILRQKREATRYSIRKLAKELTLSFSLLAAIEARTKKAPLAAAFALADFFAVEVWEMFGGDGFALRLMDGEE